MAPSKFAAILKELNIDESLTKPIQKEKSFNKVKDTVALIKGNNQQLDILYLPTTTFGYKYLLTACDLATNACDFEPMKHKTPTSVLIAYKKINTRVYIKRALVTITTDSGNEFKGEFGQYLTKHEIFHRITMPDRHRQTANIESLNKQLGRLINGYLNKIEVETGHIAKSWLPCLSIIREGLNKIRIIKTPDDINSYHYPVADGSYQVKKGKKLVDIYIDAKFKVGDMVYYKSEVPLNALGHKQNTKLFRVGDIRYNLNPKKIIKVLNYPSPNPYRYMLEGIPNVSYTDKELKKVNQFQVRFSF
jgi:hypothetical protein